MDTVKQQHPQVGFLITGIALMFVGLTFFYFYNGSFLFYLYFILGIICTYYYYASLLILSNNGLTKRTLLLIRKTIKWNDVHSCKGSFMKSIILESKNTKIIIPDIYKDRKQIIDYIIRHSDKTKISGILLSEWSQYFFLYQDNNHLDLPGDKH
jgi:hypothetical protein